MFLQHFALFAQNPAFSEPPKEEPSLFQELLEYFYKNYGNVNLGEYEHFGFSKTASTLTVIVFGMMLGVILASIFMVIQRKVAGQPVRRLLSMEALSPESAKRLSELGISEKRLRFFFRHNLALRKTVACVPLSSDAPAVIPKASNATDVDPALPNEELHIDCMTLPILYHLPKNADLSQYGFYIPKELQNRAHFRYKTDGTSFRFAIISSIVFVGLAFLLLRFLPEFMQFLDNVIGFFENL